MSSVKTHKDLDIWQRGIGFVEQIYLLTRNFPKEEMYGLTSQIRRAAVSIPSNIAEGFVRHHAKEYKQFLYISSGSCAELDTHSIISHKRKYITNKQLDDLSEDLNHEMRMLVNLIKKL